MENIIDFPNRDAIETEACAWVTKIDAHNGLAREDAASLRAWAARSPLHYQELCRIANLWGDLNELTELLPELSELPAQEPSSSSTTWNVFSRLANWVSESFGVTRAATGFAAGVLLLASVVVITNLYLDDPEHRTYITAIGQQRSIELPDGSVMQLNTNSRVKIDFTQASRSLRLEKGQAHFQVTHDKTRPFEVMAGAGLVRAIGTAFSVYLDQQKVDVVVTEGLVEVAASPARANPLRSASDSDVTNDQALPVSKTVALVSAKQNVSYNGQINKVRNLEQDELTKKLSWRKGMLLFSGESLEQVIAEVTRYTSQSIVIIDPSIRDIRIAGYFKADDTKALFDALSVSFGIQVTALDKQLVHLSRLQKD